MPVGHIFAAVFHELGIPVAECAVSEKTNEIPVSLELLKAFDDRHHHGRAFVPNASSAPSRAGNHLRIKQALLPPRQSESETVV